MASRSSCEGYCLTSRVNKRRETLQARPHTPGSRRHPARWSNGPIASTAELRIVSAGGENGRVRSCNRGLSSRGDSRSATPDGWTNYRAVREVEAERNEHPLLYSVTSRDSPTRSPRCWKKRRHPATSIRCANSISTTCRLITTYARICRGRAATAIGHGNR